MLNKYAADEKNCGRKTRWVKGERGGEKARSCAKRQQESSVATLVAFVCNLHGSASACLVCLVLRRMSRWDLASSRRPACPLPIHPSILRLPDRRPGEFLVGTAGNAGITYLVRTITCASIVAASAVTAGAWEIFDDPHGLGKKKGHPATPSSRQASLSPLESSHS